MYNAGRAAAPANATDLGDMTDDLFPSLPISTRNGAEPRRTPLSRKQRILIDYTRKAGELTLEHAVGLVGHDIYCNRHKHVGNILANMVRRGMLVRVKPGVFRMP
jgi:hypothetical protein